MVKNEDVMLIQEIKKLQLQKELVSIRRGCSDEDQTGRFEFINHEIALFSLYSDEGEFDGYTFFYVNQITEIMWGNREHKSIATLIENRSKPKLLLGSESFVALLKEAAAKYDSLCIYHTDEEDSFDIAKILDISDGWVKIQTYGPKRTLSKLFKLIELESIVRVTVDSPYQNNIVRLHGSDL